jgi:hypothetical protein
MACRGTALPFIRLRGHVGGRGRKAPCNLTDVTGWRSLITSRSDPFTPGRATEVSTFESQESCLRGAYCLHHQGGESVRHNNLPEQQRSCNYLFLRRCENCAVCLRLPYYRGLREVDLVIRKLTQSEINNKNVFVPVCQCYPVPRRRSHRP